MAYFAVGLVFGTPTEHDATLASSRDTRTDPRYRASGLNLLVAAHKNGPEYPRSQGYEPTPSDLAHLSPLGWEYINLTGDYHWETLPSLGPDQFRLLRTLTQTFAAVA